jgi:hypothetical protein
MNRTGTIKITLAIDVDLEAWADTYGIPVREAADDAVAHLSLTVPHAVAERLNLLAAGAKLAVDPATAANVDFAANVDAHVRDNAAPYVTWHPDIPTLEV